MEMPEICAVRAPGLKEIALLEQFWIEIHDKILFANVTCSLCWHETCWCVHVSVLQCQDTSVVPVLKPY